LFFEHVVLFKLRAHMSFVLLVVRSDLRLALLINLDFEPSFAWPLFTEIFVQLVNGLVLQLLALRLNFLKTVKLFCE
jgi:hypothetical protein